MVVKFTEKEFPKKCVDDIIGPLEVDSTGVNTCVISFIPTSDSVGDLIIEADGERAQEFIDEVVYNYVQRNWFTKVLDSWFD